MTPVMYLGEILGSVLTAAGLIWTMNSSAIVVGAYEDGKCPDAVAPITYALGSLILVKTILSCIACLILCTRSLDENF